MKNNTGYWFLFLVAGLCIFILGGLHMAAIHMDGVLGIFNPAGGSALDWENVSARSTSLPFTLVYIVLLAAVLYHGFYGLLTILEETSISEAAVRGIRMVLWIAGLFLFGFGSYAALSVRCI